MEFENKVAGWRIFSFCAFGLAFFFLGRDIAAAVRTEYFYDVAHPKTQKVLSKYVPAAYVKSKLLDEPVLLMSPPTKGKLCGKKKGKLLEEYQSSHHAAGTLGISVGDVEAACNKREKHGCPVKGDQNLIKWKHKHEFELLPELGLGEGGGRRARGREQTARRHARRAVAIIRLGRHPVRGLASLRELLLLSEEAVAELCREPLLE